MLRETPIATVSLRLAYASSEITRLHDAVQVFATPFSPPEKTLREFILAVEEIATNAINHGRNSAAEPWFMVEVKLENETLCCEIIDTAAPFDPFVEAPAPDLTSSVSERPVGGLGIHLTKKMVDKYFYHRRNERNHTTLIKNLACDSGQIL